MNPAVLELLRVAGLAGPAENPPSRELTGGVSSEIWRVDLATGPVCVKRALPRLRVTQVWEARSRYIEALAGHALAVEAASHLNLRPMLLRNLRWQGRMLLEQGEYAEANILYDRALALAMDEEDEKEIAWVYHDQAWQAMEQSRGEDADRLLATSIGILEEYHHQDELPPILLLLARRCVDRGDFEKAEVEKVSAAMVMIEYCFMAHNVPVHAPP